MAAVVQEALVTANGAPLVTKPTRLVAWVVPSDVRRLAESLASEDESLAIWSDVVTRLAEPGALATPKDAWALAAMTCDALRLLTGLAQSEPEAEGLAACERLVSLVSGIG